MKMFAKDNKQTKQQWTFNYIGTCTHQRVPQTTTFSKSTWVGPHLTIGPVVAFLK